MKTKIKIAISIIIFIGIVFLLKGVTVNVAGVGQSVPLSNLPWGFEKGYIWFLIILSAGALASIPWLKKILNSYSINR